jgi:hypothetical protein
MLSAAKHLYHREQDSSVAEERSLTPPLRGSDIISVLEKAMFTHVHLLDGKLGGMLHFATLEISKRGGAQLMMINMNQFFGKAFTSKSGDVDFDSRSAPAHR